MAYTSSASASAVTILTFAESGINPPSATQIIDNGNGTTSLITNIGVTVSAISGPAGASLPITDAVFKLNGMSITPAATFTLAGITYYFQRFSGTFSITAPECGTNCLSGTWADLMTGPLGGFALALDASDPPVAGLTFLSDTIPLDELQLPRAMALAKTALTKPVAIDCSAGCTLASTSANVSGTFSAAIPEPRGIAVLGGALVALGLGRKLRRLS